MLHRGVLAAATWIVATSGCLGAAGPQTAAAAEEFAPLLPDPSALGARVVERLEYDLGYMQVTDGRTALSPFPAQLIGSVHYPRDAAGPFPVVLLMHGRHATCGVRGFGETLGPILCPEGPVTYPVDSYAGYDYISEPLASRGYVVISVSANNVNDLDNQYGDYGATARAQLIVRTLDDFLGFNRSAGPEPIGDRLVGKMDFSRVGLMGHSRGGEGVTRAITYNRDRTDGPPHQLRAVFALAPTDFARWKAPDVVFATLLPYCDGDVSNLQGAWIYDDARYLTERRPSPKIQILALGSNHNFYNTVWTYDDGSRFRDDPHCDPDPEARADGFVKLGPEDQRRHGRFYIESFFRAYLGGERALVRLFTGEADPPAAACPAGRDACRGLLHVSYHAPAPDRLVIEDTFDARTLTANDAGGANTFVGFANRTVCAPSACPTQPNYAGATQLALGWSGAEALATLQVAPGSRDLSRYDTFSFRVGVAAGDARNGGLTSQDLRIGLGDAAGTHFVNARDWGAALFVPPGAEARKITLNQVRVPLAAFPGLDPSAVETVVLRFDGPPAGLIQLTDLLFEDLAGAADYTPDSISVVATPSQWRSRLTFSRP